jgi:hypothetical protein
VRRGGCPAASNPHCAICVVPGRCCLAETSPAGCAGVRDQALHAAITRTPPESPADVSSLKQLIRVEVALQLPAPSLAAALPPGATPDYTLSITQEVLEHDVAPES